MVRSSERTAPSCVRWVAEPGGGVRAVESGVRSARHSHAHYAAIQNIEQFCIEDFFWIAQICVLSDLPIVSTVGSRGSAVERRDLFGSEKYALIHFR